jgi:uncharacterized membrane protein
VKETMRKAGKSLQLNDDKGYTIAVALALIVVSSILVGYYLVSRLPPEGYTTIYMLDSQKKAIDYPELLVINGNEKNNTFNVWIVVENHMNKRQSCVVMQKVTNNPISSFPVEADANSNYTKTIENGETWETSATVSINEPGSYSVIFELWIYDETGALKFSYDYCVLPIEVVDQL